MNNKFISEIMLLDLSTKNLNYIIKINLEKIFLILIKKFEFEILIFLNYFKYRLTKYINYIYLYVKISFN
jgi:hypothetical protein